MPPFPDTSVVRTRCYSSALRVSQGAVLLDCQAELSSETSSAARRHSPVSVLLNCERTTRRSRSATSAQRGTHQSAATRGTGGCSERQSREESEGPMKGKESLSLSLSSPGNWLTQYYNNKRWQAAQHHCTLVVSEL